MAQLNTLPIEKSQITDFIIEKSVGGSENKKGDGNFSTIIDRYIASEVSGNTADKAKNGGNKLSTEELHQANASDNSVNKPKVGNGELNTQSTDIEEETITDELSSVNNERTAFVDLGQLEQSQQFISLVNSANKILQTPPNDKLSSHIESLATSDKQVLLVQQHAIADDMVIEKDANKSQSSVEFNDALALKISQTIKNTQFKSPSTEKEPLNASNYQATVGENTEQESDNVSVDDKLLLSDKFVGQTALTNLSTKSRQTDVALKDTSQGSQSLKGHIESSLPVSPTLKSESLKKAELTSDNQQAFVNQQIETKANRTAHQADTQSKDSLSKELQHEQNVSVLSSLAETSDVIATKNDLVNPNVSAAPLTSQLTDISSQATRRQELGSSQVAIEDISHSVINERISQVKNDAVVLNETIAIVRKDFAEAVKDKIMVIISQKLQQFDIRLDPPELGSVHVRVNLQHEQAVVNFVVQNQQAKEAFEENLGKLKDMLSQNGVDVGDASVEQQAQQSGDEQKNGQLNDSGSGDEQNEAESAETILSAELFKSSSSAVDYYA